MSNDNSLDEMDRDFIREVFANICKRAGIDFLDVVEDAAEAISGKYGGHNDAPDILAKWQIT